MRCVRFRCVILPPCTILSDMRPQLVSIRYSMSENIAEHPIHVPAIRGPLTKNLGVVFGDVVDEINEAFADTIDRKLKDSGTLSPYGAVTTDEN